MSERFFLVFVFLCIQTFCYLLFELDVVSKETLQTIHYDYVCHYFFFFFSSPTEITTIVYQCTESAVVHQLFYGQRGLVGVSVEWQSSQIVLMALIILLIRVRGKTGNVRFFNEQKTVLSQP